MPYTRTMKDGSKKMYHTREELNKLLDARIENNARDLVVEMRESKKEKGNIQRSHQILTHV